MPNDLPADPLLEDWLAETYTPGDKWHRNNSGLEVLSWEPRIFVYRGFLSDDECEEIKKAAGPRLYRSGVVDAETGMVRRPCSNRSPDSCTCVCMRSTPPHTSMRVRTAVCMHAHAAGRMPLPVCKYAYVKARMIKLYVLDLELLQCWLGQCATCISSCSSPSSCSPPSSTSDRLAALPHQSKNDDIRTSKGMFFSYGENEAVSKVERRVARITMTHPLQGEGMQVLKYGVGASAVQHSPICHTKGPTMVALPGARQPH